MKVTAAFISLGILFHPAAALAYCSAPSAPNFYDSKPTPPSVPYCVNEFSNTHTCDDYTIDRYNNDVERYNSELQSYQYNASRYIDELNRYVSDAQSYAECEADDL